MPCSANSRNTLVTKSIGEETMRNTRRIQISAALLVLATVSGCSRPVAKRHLFSGQRVKNFNLTPAGVDHLQLSATDVILVPGKGTYEVDLQGSFAVDRQQATTEDWNTAEVFVTLHDIDLRGSAPGLGDVAVRRNTKAAPLQGQVFAVEGAVPGVAPQAKSCRIPANVEFEIGGMDVHKFGGTSITLFNKEPIVLMNNGIERIPPVDDDRGSAHVYQTPLFDKRNPRGKPVAYLMKLDYSIGNYLPSPTE
jgi:hypothetical protein